MSFADPGSNGRLPGAIAAGLVQAGLLYALLVGLAVPMPGRVEDDLTLVTATLPPPPPRPRERIKPHPIHSKRREGAASPPNLRAKRTEVVAPVPIVPVPVPPRLTTAVVAGIGEADHAGAADVRGPGSGSGGTGNGTGSGERGDGSGDGGDYLPPVQRKGRLKMSDLPRSIRDTGTGGSVGVRFLVDTDGRVVTCGVTQSSGNAELDAATCRSILKRFRFDPSRDDRGRPVRAWVAEEHSWEIEDVSGTDAD